MPKIATDYSTRPVSFYKFVCQNEEIQSSYVGSTVDFTKRKAVHKSACNNENHKKHHLQIYQMIRDNGGWDNWKMLEIESRPVKDKREAERIEQEWIDKLKADMNTQKAFGAETIEEYHKQYYIENADNIKEQQKQYRIENADKRNQYIIDNIDRLKDYRKQYYIDNLDKIKEQNRQTYLKKKANALEATS